MGNSEGPRAPRDPAAKRRGFYIMRGKQIAGSRSRTEGAFSIFTWMEKGL